MTPSGTAPGVATPSGATPSGKAAIERVGVRIHRGTVAEFDDARGAGWVIDGEQSWPFHCTGVADGSRSIDPGAEVSFRIVPGRLGKWEATDLIQIR